MLLQLDEVAAVAAGVAVRFEHLGHADQQAHREALSALQRRGAHRAASTLPSRANITASAEAG